MFNSSVDTDLRNVELCFVLHGLVLHRLSVCLFVCLSDHLFLGVISKAIHKVKHWVISNKNDKAIVNAVGFLL